MEDQSKTLLKVKFIALNVYIKKNKSLKSIIEVTTLRAQGKSNKTSIGLAC